MKKNKIKILISECKNNMANIFYILGSLCFLIGTLINIFKK